ncbi:MAG: hypothetical protein AB1659_01175 [Thermodesulfobacteriota bacterium]
MKKIEKEISAVAKKIAALGRQLDRIATQISKGKPKSTAAKKTGTAARTRKKAGKKASLVDQVIHVIGKAKKGLNIPALKKKTGLGDRQLSNVLYKLTKKGIVKTEARGIYIKG